MTKIFWRTSNWVFIPFGMFMVELVWPYLWSINKSLFYLLRQLLRGAGNVLFSWWKQFKSNTSQLTKPVHNQTTYIATSSDNSTSSNSSTSTIPEKSSSGPSFFSTMTKASPDSSSCYTTIETPSELSQLLAIPTTLSDTSSFTTIETPSDLSYLPQITETSSNTSPLSAIIKTPTAELSDLLAKDSFLFLYLSGFAGKVVEQSYCTKRGMGTAGIPNVSF